MLSFEFTNNVVEWFKNLLPRIQSVISQDAAMDEWEAIVLNRVRDRYLKQVDPDNVPWKPSKRAIRTGGKTLYLSGTLFHSIQAFRNPDGTRGIGTDVFYGKFHQEGLGVPMRRFLGVNEIDLKLVQESIFKRVLKAFLS